MKTNWILIGLVLLFLATRLINISKVPASLYWDEASIGYNAYTIGIDGKDEWGDKLPIHFRAFGEFKLPVYIYSVVPFIKIFGLSILAVRLPSVFYSLAIVLITFLIAKKLLKNNNAALFSAFFMVVTPWIFIFSRTGYEAMAGLFFYLAALYFYLLSFNNAKWFLATALSLVVSMYSYNSFRVLSILTILPFLAYLFWINKKNLKKNIPIFLLSMAIFALSWVPIYRLYKYDMGGQRLTAVGLSGTTIQKLAGFTKNYFIHYSPDFLFVKGDPNLRSQMPGFGQLYWVSLLFILLGIYYMTKRRSWQGTFILYLLLISSIPGALTRESPHALRAISAIPFYAVIAGAGFMYLVQKYKKYDRAIIYISVLAYLLCFGLYLRKFLTIYSITSSKDWQYGYYEIYRKYATKFHDYSGVFISDEYGQPYIFTLFYQKLAPNYREMMVLTPIDKWGQSKVLRIGREYEYKFTFDEFGNNILVFATEKEKIKDAQPIDEIKFLDGSTAFWVYKL